MRSSNYHGGPTAGRISVEAATKAALIQSDIEKIKESWEAFRSADTVRLSVRAQAHFVVCSRHRAGLGEPSMTSVASILQQHFEEQIQELNKEVSALGFEPTIVSLEPCSEGEASE